ncbi:GntR family transcriptional regulator [Maribacter antarcticus]|uniref:GntR family transcriptional regulator n=1 Tax=Maribacter antarcticus TaxID=505250 RepID=UPI000687C731|nr:GntR family transcriptional regulator [Maribacter antarcticus]
MKIFSTRSPPVSGLAEKVNQIFEEMIETLKLQPGTIISESDLQERLEIGRTPLRRALKRLAQKRLVTILPRRGTLISKVDIQAQLEIVKLRKVVDKLIVGEATKRLTLNQALRLGEIAEEIVVAAERDNILEFIRLDNEFDQMLQVASRNFFASHVVETTHAHCRRF